MDEESKKHIDEELKKIGEWVKEELDKVMRDAIIELNRGYDRATGKVLEVTRRVDLLSQGQNPRTHRILVQEIELLAARVKWLLDNFVVGAEVEVLEVRSKTMKHKKGTIREVDFGSMRATVQFPEGKKYRDYALSSLIPVKRGEVG